MGLPQNVGDDVQRGPDRSDRVVDFVRHHPYDPFVGGLFDPHQLAGQFLDQDERVVESPVCERRTDAAVNGLSGDAHDQVVPRFQPGQVGGQFEIGFSDLFPFDCLDIVDFQ